MKFLMIFLYIFALGPKFAVPPNIGSANRKLMIELIASIKTSLKSIPNNDTDQFHICRLKLSHVLQRPKINQKKDIELQIFFKKILIDLNKAKIFLKQNSHLILTKTDKCKISMLLTKEQYYEVPERFKD